MAAFGLMVAGCAPLSERAGSPDSAPQPKAVAPRTPQVQPAKLIGMDMPRLQTALGLPSVTRHERPAQIWQYRSANCVLDVFFYEEAGAPRVVHLEARDRQAQPVALEACLPEVAALDRGRG